jgi:hypothetical protein
MSFQRLAQVEVQCIMQMLDRVSLLALAQCNTHSLRAADVSFVWKHVAPMHVNHIPIIAYRLGRHIPINWIRIGKYLSAREVQSLNQSCNLQAIRITQSAVDAFPLDQYTSCAAMQSVRFAWIHTFLLGQNEIRALCSLPNLTSLRFSSLPNSEWDLYFRSGSLPHNITYVRVDYTSAFDPVSSKARFDALLGCGHVTQLHVALNGNHGHAFLTSLANRTTSSTLTNLAIYKLACGSWVDLQPLIVSAFRGISSLFLDVTHFLSQNLHHLSDCMDLCYLHLFLEPCDDNHEQHIAAIRTLHARNREKKNQMHIYLHVESADVPTTKLESLAFLTLCRKATGRAWKQAICFLE